jgi:hypothetical protein
MKHYLSLVASLFIYSQVALACSELGPHEFAIPKHLEISCSKVAAKVALAMANTLPKIERKFELDAPKGKSSIENITLYRTIKNTNQQKIIGYNVALNTQNNWQCNYCIEMELDSKNRCYVIQASKFMCAK